ncbi:MAG TPA: J domain-containing protein [Thermomicrobiales bacterium]|nr:J domain-containing protein [Thermomicrobiales bacterium]
MAATRGTGRAASDQADPDAPDLYQLLDVAYTATPSEITRAYRRAMKRTHPDRQRAEQRAAAEEEAKQLNLAYSTLSDPNRRAAYDATARAQAVQDQVMRQYVSSAFYPGWAADAEAREARLRRERSDFERHEVRTADRSALFTLVIVFGGFTVLLIGLLILFGLLQSLAQTLF